jgi:ribosome-associated protein
MIPITETLTIDERALEWQFVRASGPGGQNVNKVSSAVQLRFDTSMASLDYGLLQRLRQLAGRRMTAEGVLVIDARRFRSQDMNRADALERLKEMLQAAAVRPKKRHKTKPSRASRERRLEKKHRRGDVKRGRRGRADYD